MGLSALEIAGAALPDLYQIGVRMDVYAIRTGNIIRSGEAWISTDYGRRSNVHPFGLQFVPPEDLDETLAGRAIPLHRPARQHDRRG